jgi:hypothetical protein
MLTPKPTFEKEAESMPGDDEGPFCPGCPGPQPYMDCEGCDESEEAKEERRAAVMERGAS